MGGIRLELVGCLVLAWFIVFLALIKGVKSLGKAVYFTAIFPYLILTVLLCFGLSLDGAMAGILYYVTPRLDRLTDVQVYSSAKPPSVISVQRCFLLLIGCTIVSGLGRCCNADLLLTGALLGILDHAGQLQQVQQQHPQVRSVDFLPGHAISSNDCHQGRSVCGKCQLSHQLLLWLCRLQLHRVHGSHHWEEN